MAGRVVIIGSINVDMVIAADRLPAPGETVLGGRFAMHPGGKGANQAVAAARAGAEVELIGAVGEDEHGDAALAGLSGEGIDVTRIKRVAEPTGVALIAVGPRGENQIVVAPGANATVEPDDIRPLEGDVLLTNHEIPMHTAAAALDAGRVAGMITILNPAPAHALSAEVLAASPILVPNEHELVVAIGNDDPAAALEELASRTGAPVIITQGPAGVLLASGSERRRFPGFRPPVEVDATGAGDTFAGVLAAWLATGAEMPDAITAANAAAALSVARAGAREGMPSQEEITAFVASSRT